MKKKYHSPKFEKHGDIKKITNYIEHEDTDGHCGCESHE